MRQHITIALLALGLGSAGCETVWGELPDAKALELDDDDGPGTVILEEQVIVFSLGEDGQPVATTTETRQGHVRGERGQWMRILSAGYDSSFTEIVDVSVRTRTPDGTTKVLGREAAQDMPSFGYQLYSDQRALLIAPPTVPSGTVVETRAVTRMKQPNLFLFGQTFGTSLPTKMSRFVVEVPIGWEIQSVGEQAQQAKDMPPTTENDGSVVRHTWERADIAGKNDVPRGLSASAQLESVFVRLKSWTDASGVVHKGPADDKELSKFLHELQEGQQTPTPAIEKTVRELLAQAGEKATAREKARKLYAWTRDNTRYCAVHVGLGGWKPHDAAKTHELRYGDCKDKANLLRSMLQVAGIPSRPAAIYAADQTNTFRLPVMGANFNHEILVVDLPEGPVVVDPTSRTTAFGDVPQVDEDRMMLPFSAQGDALVPSPASSPDKDVLDERYDLVLGDDGQARGSFTSTLSGELSDDIRAQLLYAPKGRHDNVVADSIGIVRPRLEGFSIANAAPPEEPTPVEITGKLKLRMVRGASIARANVLLRASKLFGSPFPSVDEEAQEGPRPGPFLLGHRRTKKAVVTLQLPPSLRVARVPDETNLDSAWGTFKTKWSTTGGDERTLVLERTVVWKERIVNADEVDKLRAFIATALAADETPVALVQAEGP